MTDEREQLNADILRYLATPSVPTAPVPPGPDATSSQTETYLAAVRDQEVHAIMAKSGIATQSDMDRLRMEINLCLKREGLA